MSLDVRTVRVWNGAPCTGCKKPLEQGKHALVVGDDHWHRGCLTARLLDAGRPRAVADVEIRRSGRDETCDACGGRLAAGLPWRWSPSARTWAHCRCPVAERGAA